MIIILRRVNAKWDGAKHQRNYIEPRYIVGGSGTPFEWKVINWYAAVTPYKNITWVHSCANQWVTAD